MVASLSYAGCDDDGPGEVREWRPSDHQQPAEPESEPTAAPDPGEAAGPPPEAIARAAAALFGSRCASCHGIEGHGDGPDAPTAQLPDLASAAYQEDRTDTDIARVIRMGQGLMPAFGTQLNERGIAALVGHVRSLGPAPDDAAPDDSAPDPTGSGAPENSAPDSSAPENSAPDSSAPENSAPAPDSTETPAHAQ